MKTAFLYIMPEIFGLSIEVYFITFVIAIPINFFFRWLFKKIIKQSKNRKIATCISTLLMVTMVYNLAISMFFIALFYEPKRNFDKLSWVTNKQERFQMANSIIESKLLINNDTNQVKLLLGNPTFRNNSSKTWNYDMGMGGGGLGFLFHNLVLKFGKNKVTSVKHQEIED